jgi:chaperone modulatory protein CbpM
MLTEHDIVAKVRQVSVTRLRIWVRQGWIRHADEGKGTFTEADLARAAMIRDLEDKLGFDEEQVPVLLNLIDQIHGLRAQLKTMLDAFEKLPPEARTKVKMRVVKRKPTPSRRR